MRKIVVSAPGKIHLMGEHAVVWGKPALLTAVNRRLKVEAVTASQLTIKAFEEKLVKKAVMVTADYLKIKNPRVSLTITSDLPPGRHLGSSAAVGVAVVAALLYFFKKIWNLNLVNKLAYEVEKFQHVKPSGGDNSIVTFGGFLWYRQELPFLKSLWQLSFKLNRLFTQFYLIDTGQPAETTGEMIKLVADLVRKQPAKTQEILALNEQATKQAALALKENNEKSLKQAIKQGEKTLEALGVVSQKAVSLIKKLNQAGIAAKILGGGGRKTNVGFLLTFASNREKVEQIAGQFGYPVLPVKLGEEGVRLEN